MRQIIYRAWDGDELMYLGVTINPGARLVAHKVQSIWWSRVTNITFERLAEDLDRPAALLIEARAIRAERPLYNVACNPGQQRPPMGQRESRLKTEGPQEKPPEGWLAALRNTSARRRAERAVGFQLDAELPALVREALDAGHTWQELSEELGVSKARVYQIRDGTR